MSSVDNSHKTNRYWRSLADRADSAEFRRFLDAEFPEAAPPGDISRRRWLQLMGASLALAGVGGCRWEKSEILPFADRPPDRTPGKLQRFATAMDLAGSATGLLVTCVDGRPIKIEGNPNHPASLGATDAFAQAAVLELYDPDRSQHVVEEPGAGQLVRTWGDFTRFARTHFAPLRENGGDGFRVLSEATSSPTLAALRNRLLETFPEARWHEYEPLGPPAETAPLRFDLAEADVIVCLDDDLLASGPGALRYARQFADGRNPDAPHMKRLYCVESSLSVTGAAADHRLPLRSDRLAGFVSTLEQEVSTLVSEADATESHGSRFLPAMAEDLVAHRGRCVLTVGSGQPPEVHAAVARINATLGNLGKTVLPMEPVASETIWPASQEASLETLVADVNSGNVHTLLILGGNPVYNAPADLQFAEALGNVETAVHLSLYHDETSRRCSWHLPRAHFLESWGDARADNGAYSVVQPMIQPLYGGKSPIELLAILLEEESTHGRDLVRAQFPKILAALGSRPPTERETEKVWRETLHDGLLADSEWKTLVEGSRGMQDGSGSHSLVEMLVQPLVSAKAAVEPSSGDEESPNDDALEIVFRHDSKVHDGRFANNGWLQEMPDPVTRLTWGGAALLSPATAEELGVKDQTLVKLTYKGREAEIPAYVVPGQAYRSVAVQLGYGRTAAGHVGGLVDEGVEPVGTDVYKLRTSDAMHSAAGLTVEPTGKRVPLASVQDHFAIDAAGKKAREKRVGVLIREATLEHYQEHPHFAQHAVHHPPLESLWEEHEFQGHRWGMTVDLSKCIGCGACAVACQAENNVPVVGKERILEGREMHWLRVDRYFQGDPENPRVVLQPVACHHCELAPCEQVCPVAATVHDAEGLNVMVYNRCVGTRYCANNCPYKVRRFNYFNYHKDLADPAAEVAKMVYNPEVTVRSRGVMEKCTYCVQRIKAAGIEAKRSGGRVEDGQVKTACQQVCPTGAITFGDLADTESQVARNAAGDRNYAMLAELNIKPRTTYLARIRNPNPALEDGQSHGGTEET